MTKTIVAILITIYSVMRLFTIGAMYYYNAVQLPTAVMIISATGSLFMLYITIRCVIHQLSGKNLRLALLIGAIAAVSNMIIVFIERPETLNNIELMLTGTVFDVLVFIGSCTIKIRDTRGKAGRTPFARAAAQDKQLQ